MIGRTGDSSLGAIRQCILLSSSSSDRSSAVRRTEGKWVISQSTFIFYILEIKEKSLVAASESPLTRGT